MARTKRHARHADRFVSKRLPDYSNRALLAELRRVARLVPRPRSLTTTAFDAFGRVNSGTYRERFGNWPAALRAAGLGARVAPRGGDQGRIAEDKCFENLRILWDHYGRPPVQRECYRPPSTIGGHIYNARFGSWRRALAAFVTWAKSGRMPPRLSPGNRYRSQSMPLRLRYAVLKRDGFHCVACGAAPDPERGITLEIDHKKPRAQGGTTTLDNLQTLCRPCNRGKRDYKGTETMPARWRSAEAAWPRRAGARAD